MKRSSGVLLHISSLPSKYGIGTFGEEAYKFADFLKAAGQKYWQILPLGPTSYGDSPYQSFSTFAGNPYFIDLDMLIEDGLITKKDVTSLKWGDNPEYVDYGQMYKSRYKVLRKAYKNGFERDKKEVEAFVKEKESWIENYALYMAIKAHFDMKSWEMWPEDDIRLHKAAAVKKYAKELKEDVNFWIYVQYLFFKQWSKLKAYINKLGIKVIGDIPIYVAMDSADVWAEPKFFQLNTDNIPLAVAGVPPDFFSEDGQLWGNPLYDWDVMKKDNYSWWRRRIEGNSALYDAIRIDHFRGFDAYWKVPYGAKTAKGGQWITGPGEDFVKILKNEYKNIEFIAEDLGEQSPSLTKLLKFSGFPGMKVLEFAFDGNNISDFMPHKYGKNCICYTGTHDNEPVLEWKKNTSRKALKQATEYIGINSKEGINYSFIRAGLSSNANLFVAQMQDYLGLGEGSRINMPGTASGNWQWRMSAGVCTDELADKMNRLRKLYSR